MNWRKRNILIVFWTFMAIVVLIMPGIAIWFGFDSWAIGIGMMCGYLVGHVQTALQQAYRETDEILRKLGVKPGNQEPNP